MHSCSVTLLQGAGLFDRLQEACTRGVAAADEGCMTVAQLKEPEGSQTLQPRLLVVCCPAGVGLDPIMQALLEGYPNSLCRVVSHTSRVPLVSYFGCVRLGSLPDLCCAYCSLVSTCNHVTHDSSQMSRCGSLV